MNYADKSKDRVTPAGGCGCLGCLGIVALIGYFIISLFGNGDATRGQQVAPMVLDAAQILDDSTAAAISRIRFPPGVVVLVRTVQRIPSARIGNYAIDRMGDERYWKQVRPRNWLRRVVLQDGPSDMGIYVVVSESPSLIQIRYGRKLRLEAYRAGLAFGPEYRRIQSVQQDPSHATLNAVRWLSIRVPEALDLPVLLRWARRLASLIYAQAEDWIAPGELLFSETTFPIYLEVISKWRVRSPWELLVITVFIYVIGVVCARVLARWQARTFIPKALRIAGIVLTGVVVPLGALLNGFAALTLLGRGRIEDELALQALGFPDLSFAAFSPAAFGIRTWLVLALITGLIVFILETFLNTWTDYNDAGHVRDQSLGTGCGCLALPALMLFLPLPVGLLVAVVIILQLLSALWERVRTGPGI